MRRVEILNDNHLVTGGEALSRGDDGPGEEEFPNLSSVIRLDSHTIRERERERERERDAYSVPSGSVFGLDRFDVSSPVTVPSPQCSRIVYTDGINSVCH